MLENEKNGVPDEEQLVENSDPSLDKSQALLTMYDDFVERKPRCAKGKFTIEFSLQMKSLQDWFMRCSWPNKLLVIKIFLAATNGCFVLEIILKHIQGIFSKDVLESLSKRCPAFAFDTIVADDNRSMDMKHLENVIKTDFFWFIGLEPTYQARVILKLLRLGGGGLMYRIYRAVHILFEDRYKTNVIYMRLPSFYRYSSEDLIRKVNVRNRMISATPLISEEEVEELLKKKEKETARRESELNKYREIKGIEAEEYRKRFSIGHPGIEIDCIQVLPIGLSRRIISYVDDEDLEELKNVGTYWSKMIDESINEVSGRKAINAKINRVIGEKPTNPKKIDEDFFPQPELVNALGKNAFLKQKMTVQHSSTLYEVEEVLDKNFEEKVYGMLGFSGRVFCIDNTLTILACSFPTNTVQFYSLRNGKKLNFSVYGIESAITCLCLHENLTDIFIGCEDGSIICKDMRTSKRFGSFKGHTKKVISLYLTARNLLSASKDNSIKYFKLWSAVCLLFIDLSQDYNLSSVFLIKGKQAWCVAGTEEGFVFLVDIKNRQCLSKVKLHNYNIVQMEVSDDVLVTGCKNGIVRVWDLNTLNDNIRGLWPYYTVNVENNISSLDISDKLILVGCENGIFKIISTSSGTIVKAMKISSQTPILGSAITKDKVSAKLIIWHEGGIEMRTFSLVKGFSYRKSMENIEVNTKTNKLGLTTQSKIFENFVGSQRKSLKVVEVLPKHLKKNIFLRKKPRQSDNICTYFSYQKKAKPLNHFTSSIFTNVLNDKLTLIFGGDVVFKSFPRFKTDTKKTPKKCISIQDISKF